MSDNTQHDEPVGGSGFTRPDPTGSSPPVQPTDRRFTPPLIAAIVLGALLVVGVAVAGIVAGPQRAAPAPQAPPAPPKATGPVLLVPVAAPNAGSAQCAKLVHALPATLGSGATALHGRKLATPAPPAAAAWGAGDDPVVLRCGIERPPELRPTSDLLQVDGVNWLQVSQDGASTWYAVDRAAVVALTLPGDVGGTGPIQDVSSTIEATMPAVPVF